MKTYYKDADGILHWDVYDPNYINMLHFVNDLYTSGLLDREWVVNNNELFTQKLSAGNIMGCFNAYWDPGDANTAIKPAKKEKTDSMLYIRCWATVSRRTRLHMAAEVRWAGMQSQSRTTARTSTRH